MAKFLVTGGSGFIGTNLMAKLIDENHEVLNIDIQEPKLKEYERFFKKIDLCDLESLETTIILFNPNNVIHLGARTDLNGRSLKDYQANIEGVKNLLLVLDKLNNLERVIFASSMYVCQPGYVPKNDNDFKPHTIYGESKVLTEKLIKERNPSYIWTIIRPTSIWGIYFGEPYNLFFKIVLSHKYFHMGHKACKKTYGYIENFIYQIESILKVDRNQIDKKVFYLGDYEPYYISSWADEIANYRQIKIPNVPYLLFKMAAYLGDRLATVGLKFPMTSFRLRNMTTDNVFDLSEIKKIAPNLPVRRIEGTKKTIDWLTKKA